MAPAGGWPQLKAAVANGADAVYVQTYPNAAETEAFRTLRTALAMAEEGAARIVVSSSEPGDGKTTVVSNLAAAIAQSGKRTLVIDSDLRKPGMTALLDLKGQPGVTDLLATDGDVGALAERCLYRTEVPNLDVIPAGPRRPGHGGDRRISTVQ